MDFPIAGFHDHCAPGKRLLGLEGLTYRELANSAWAALSSCTVLYWLRTRCWSEVSSSVSILLRLLTALVRQLGRHRGWLYYNTAQTCAYIKWLSGSGARSPQNRPAFWRWDCPSSCDRWTSWWMALSGSQRQRRLDLIQTTPSRQSNWRSIQLFSAPLWCARLQISYSNGRVASSPCESSAELYSWVRDTEAACSVIQRDGHWLPDYQPHPSWSGFGHQTDAGSKGEPLWARKSERVISLVNSTCHCQVTAICHLHITLCIYIYIMKYHYKDHKGL